MLAILPSTTATLSLVAAAAPLKACLVGKREALMDGRFTGPLVCSKKDATFKLVGRPHGSRYSIYDYRYRFLPHSGGVMHGGQRIIVFRGNKYVGQYALSPPPYADLRINGSEIVLQTSGSREGVRLDFSKQPPRKPTINGEIETFHR